MDRVLADPGIIPADAVRNMLTALRELLGPGPFR